MDAETLKTNLNTVKELILDEHKLVTYITLSKDLCIHVNEAKSLLCQTIKDIRKVQPESDICVCYMISGLLCNNSACTTICTEKELKTLKKTLKIVYYEHVYAVSRGAVDYVALTAVNNFEDLPLCIGLIKASSCNKRTNDEVYKVYKLSKNHASESKQLNVQPVSSKDKVKELTNGHSNVQKANHSKSNIKSEFPSPVKCVSNHNKISTKTNGNKSTAKSITGFFKVNGDSTKVKNTIKMQDTQVKVEKEVKVEPLSTDSDMPSTTKTNGSSKKDAKKKNNNNSLTEIKKNAKVDKKRKRLLHVSDSESENEENDPFTNEMDVDNESEDEIPPTPTVNTVKITSGIVNPKKRRKIVDKTYTDEDGYILTKKEEVYESCSDNENDATDNISQEKDSVLVKEYAKEVKNVDKIKKENTEVNIVKTESSPKEKQNKGNKKKKVSPPHKGKQSTINSFFKKV